MLLVSLPAAAWAKVICAQDAPSLAGISAYVYDKVIMSGSFRHLQELLERTVHFDRLSGQYLNFDKSTGLCATKDGEKKLKSLTSKGTPLLIVKNAKSLRALVSSATLPSNFTARQSVDSAVPITKPIHKLSIELRTNSVH